MRDMPAASLTPSEASETFSGVFWSFRGLGNVQRRVLELSEVSGRLRPPAKFAGYELLRCSAGVPDAFRDLGAAAKFSWGTRPDLAGVPDAFRGPGHF